MADRYIDFSVLNAYQDKIARTEKETQNYGLIRCLEHNTPFSKTLTPSLAAHLATVEGQTTQYTGLKEDTIVTTSTESFTIPAHLSDSEQKSLTAISIFSGFQVYPKWFVNNTIAYEEYVQNKYDEVFAAMAAAKETQIASVLSTNKTQTLSGIAQINNGDGVFAFNTGLDTLTADKAAQKDTLFSNLKTIMRINKKVGNYNMVVNEGGFNLALNEIFKFGQMNSENRQFVLNQLPMYFETLGIAPSTFQYVAYLLRDGAIAGVQNYPSDFRTGTVVGEKIWGVTDSPVPYINQKLNVYYNKEAVDASSLGDQTGHLKMTSMEEWGFLDKFFLIPSYNSDLTSRVSDIVKTTGATS
jgi:hypothetical protein